MTDATDRSAAGSTAAAPGPSFAHASEAELARILDFYEVRWEYEPHVFPILWNLDGAVVESFSPDFYLPDLDLYVELTTLKQRLVRKKNRKLRRLRELYPGVRVKLLYAKDFRALMLKYGKFGLAEELSGALGQAPGRPLDTGAAGADPTDPDADTRDATGPRQEPDAVGGPARIEEPVAAAAAAPARPRRRAARARRRAADRRRIGEP